MAHYHRRCHSTVSAEDPRPKRVLQVTFRDDTSTDPFDQTSYRHLNAKLHEMAKTHDKVVIVCPQTGRRRVLKDNGASCEPFEEPTGE